MSVAPTKLGKLQAENERLKADVEQQAENWTLLFSDYQRALARAKRLEEAITHVLHRRKNHGEIPSCSTLEAILAEGVSLGTDK